MSAAEPSSNEEAAGIALTATATGVSIPVKAQPSARQAGVKGVRDGAVRLAVTAPPEDGKANAALARLLAELLGVRPADVTLVRGPTSREKTFAVAGLTVDAARERLGRALV